MNVRTHYDNLQIQEGASDAVVRAAYRALSQQHHPDRNPDDIAGATKRMGMINRAYEVLSDPGLRAQHNAWIRTQKELRQPSSQQTSSPHPDNREEPDRPSSNGSFDQTWKDLRAAKPPKNVRQRPASFEKPAHTAKAQTNSAQVEELSILHVLCSCVAAGGYVTVNSGFYRKSVLADLAWYELLFNGYFIGLMAGYAAALMAVALVVWAGFMILKPTRKHAPLASSVITIFLFCLLLANPDGFKKTNPVGQSSSSRALPAIAIAEQAAATSDRREQLR